MMARTFIRPSSASPPFQWTLQKLLENRRENLHSSCNHRVLAAMQRPSTETRFCARYTWPKPHCVWVCVCVHVCDDPEGGLICVCVCAYMCVMTLRQVWSVCVWVKERDRESVNEKVCRHANLTNCWEEVLAKSIILSPYVTRPQTHRPVSPVPSCVSMKSDRSMGHPLNFSSGPPQSDPKWVVSYLILHFDKHTYVQDRRIVCVCVPRPTPPAVLTIENSQRLTNHFATN